MRIDATTGALVDSFNIYRAVLPLKVINGDLYGVEHSKNADPKEFKLLKFDKSNGTVIDSLPFCLQHPLGLAWADGHVWGASFGKPHGTGRIYQFNDLFTQTDVDVIFCDSFSMVPNPASDKITLSSSCKIRDVELWNAAGQKISVPRENFHPNSIELSLDGISRGIYFVRIFGASGTYVQKLIAQ